MIKNKHYIIFMVIMLSSYSLNSQNSHKRILNALAEEFRDSLNFNGSFFVAKNNDILLDKAYGYSNFEQSIKITKQTPFRIASLSKIFTSYAIYILASQNKLSIEDHIVKYVRELNSRFNNIKISYILNHKSGLARTVDSYLKDAPYLTFSLDEIISAINKTDLAFSQGNLFQYSNVGDILLGIIIEKVTSQTYGDTMRNLIFSPLESNQTSHEIGGHIIKGIASGYNYLEWKTLKSEHENKSHVLAAGSILSSISDVYRFSLEILKGTLLTKELHQQYLTLNQNFKTHGGLITWNYTSKLPMQNEKGQIVIYSGLCPRFSSTPAIFLEHRIVVIGLSNRNPIDMSNVYNKLGNVALGFYKEKVNRPTVNKLNELISKGKHNEALKQYRTLLDKEGAFKIKPTEINNLEYSYLQYRMYYEAIKAYIKAVELNPNNSQAKRVLQSLLKE